MMGQAMKIALDAMGGDHAEEVNIQGALMALEEREIEIFLVGDEQILQEKLAELGGEGVCHVVHAEEVVEMSEPAITPLRRKKNASIRVAAELVRVAEADGLISAGNTGATLATALFVIGNIEGVDRPALATTIPTRSGGAILLDVGANVDCTPHQLRQFAVMGHICCEEILGKSSPRLGLLSIGEEDSKGNDLTREVFQILKQMELNFVGNIEGRDLFDGSVDVVVCDGFIGNIALKTSEALVETVEEILREELSKSFLSRLGHWLSRSAFRDFKRRLDYSEYGGAPLLGIKRPVVVCHGRSTPKAIKNAIGIADDLGLHRVNRRIERELKGLASVEESCHTS